MPLSIRHSIAGKAIEVAYVRPSDTINKVKGKIQAQITALTWNTVLVHDGKQLEDGQTIADYGIRSWNLITVLQPKEAIAGTLVYVTNIAGNPTTLYVKDTDTIATMKATIQDITGIPPDQQRLEMTPALAAAPAPSTPPPPEPATKAPRLTSKQRFT